MSKNGFPEDGPWSVSQTKRNEYRTLMAHGTTSVYQFVNVLLGMNINRANPTIPLWLVFFFNYKNKPGCATKALAERTSS
jgi:hypothetical protein